MMTAEQVGIELLNFSQVRLKHELSGEILCLQVLDMDVRGRDSSASGQREEPVWSASAERKKRERDVSRRGHQPRNRITVEIRSLYCKSNVALYAIMTDAL